jgi:oligopeptide transport system ATP-binding protein
LKKAYLEAKSKAKVVVDKEVADVKVERRQSFLAIKAEIAAVDKRLAKISKTTQEELYNETKIERKKLVDKKRNNYEMYKRRFKVTKKEAHERAIQIMEEVGIPQPKLRFKQYPFEFSGGMRQRIVIAVALTANPSLLICDEPTTALDVTIQGQILNLIKDIKKQRDLSVIFITHDLGVVANVADRVAVMYAGKIVEYGKAEEVFYDPKHPYTWALLSSVPDLETKGKLSSIPGTPPDMLYPPKGDAFAERNQFALKIDFEAQPPFYKVSDTHYAATWLLHPDAPEIEMPEIIQKRANYYRKVVADKKNEGGKVK